MYADAYQSLFIPRSLIHLLPISKFQILPCEQPPGFRPNVCRHKLEGCRRNEVVAQVIAFPVHFTMLRNLATTMRKEALPAIGIITERGASIKNFRTGDVLLMPQGDNWVEKKCLRPSETLLLKKNVNPIQLAELIGAPRIAASIMLQGHKLCMDDWILQTEPFTSVGRYIQRLAATMRLRTINLVETEVQKVDVLERNGDVAISLQRHRYLEEIEDQVVKLGPKLAVVSSSSPLALKLESILPSYCQVVSPIPSHCNEPWWKRPVYNLSLIPGFGPHDEGKSFFDLVTELFETTRIGKDQASYWDMDDFPAAINSLNSTEQVVLIDRSWNNQL